MCGIAGIVDCEGKPVEPGLLLAMNQAIMHRGPDDEGYVVINPINGGYRNCCGASSPAEIKQRLREIATDQPVPGASIGLCHRRFSIIDLSASAHQPFFDTEQSCCVVFNGEIYNYIEVRKELEAAGARFRTTSDTEVLLAAYKRWGTDCFAKLNGFWAIALFDFEKRELIVSRDRIGKKPLYWTRAGSRFYFASEIKALFQAPEVRRNRKVNEEAISNWLAYGKKDLNSTTCFDGIFSLPAASWAVLNHEFPNNIKTYWSVPQKRLRESDISTQTAARTLRQLLEDSVSIRLRADVPLCVELSGGMDSSTLVALASQVRSQQITTYTVRFPEREWNEEPFARSVAEHCKTDYRVLDPPTSNFWSDILPFTYLEEEPYHSPNLYTNQVIWSQMRSREAKVSLNGAGGDENFAGYGGYFSLFQIENLRHGRVLAYLNNGIRYSTGRTHIRSLFLPLLRLGGALLSDNGSGGRRAKAKSNGKLQIARSLAGFGRPTTLSQALYSDMTNTLMPYWLRSGDRGYMGVPLEVRNPFLDYRVVEFAFCLPITYLIRDGWHKWILRKAVEDLLPADVVWRRQKLGFPFPYKSFYTENEAIIETIVQNCDNPYICLKRQPELRNDWNTLSFVLWYELFFNENEALFKKIREMAVGITTAENYGFTPEFLHSAELR